jgi:hypothetical protein
LESFDVFIAYSRRDISVARLIEHGLSALARPWYRRTSFHVFRDDSSLAATSDLRGDLRAALLSSRLLLVIASPASAGSPSVTSEIKQWFEAGRDRNLMVAWIDGLIAFNPELGLEAAGTSALAPIVCESYVGGAPLILDFRSFLRNPTKAAARDLDFIALLAQIGARVRGCAPKDLVSEDLRRHRQASAVATAAAAIMASLALLTTWFGINERTQRRTAELRLADGLALEGVALRRDGASSRAAAPLESAEQLYDELGYSSIAARFPEWQLRHAYLARSPAPWSASQQYRSAAVSADGSVIVLGRASQFIDLTSLRSPGIRSLDTGSAALQSVALSEDGKYLVAAVGSTVLIYNLPVGVTAPIVRITTANPVRRLSAGRGAKFAVFEAGGTVAVLEADTGRYTVAIQNLSGDVTGLTFAGSESFVAVATRDNHVRVIDVPHKSIAADIPTEGPAQGVAGVSGTQSLIFGQANGRARFRRWDAGKDDSVGLAVADVLIDVAAPADASWAVAAFASGRVIVWDPVTGTILRELIGASGPLRTIEASGGVEPVVIALSTSGHAFAWKLNETGYTRVKLRSNATDVSVDSGTCIVHDTGGRKLQFARGFPATFWNDAENAPQEWQAGDGANRSCDGVPILVATSRKRFCYVPGGESTLGLSVLSKLNVNRTQFTAGALVDTTLVLARPDGQIELRSSSDGELRASVQSESRPPILGLTLSPDARFIVTASAGAEVEVIDIERRRRLDSYKLRDFPGFETPISGGAVCAGGDCAAFITANRLVHCLWWGRGAQVP